MESLLEKLADGRYRLNPLGQTAYMVLRFTAMSGEEQVKVLSPPEKPEVEVKPKKEGAHVISNTKRLLLNKDRLEKYNSLLVEDCSEVIIDNDVDSEIFKNKVLGLRDVRRIVAPRNLYKLVLGRIEEDIEDIELYEGEPPLEAETLNPRLSNHLELSNYSENIIDCSKLKLGTRINN